ncbi:MAG: hypothetical protein ACI87W_003130 [Halieaceae bacterium]|jgi:hypothetical protein
MFVLVLLGSGIIVLLGIAHGIYTLRSTPEGGPMMPVNPEVREAMLVVDGIGLAPTLKTTLWKGWIGFNLSHSLGLIVVGLLIGLPVLEALASPMDNFAWLICALLLPCLYLWLSIRHWFAKPTMGFAIATALICSGLAGQALLN